MLKPVRIGVAVVTTMATVLLHAVELSAEVPRQPAAKPVQAKIAQVEWLAGNWSGTDGPVSFEERWTPSLGGAMLAVARTAKAGRMVAFEFLRIVERDGGLVYVAQPNGRPATDFPLTAIDAESATFENPAHDFPKTIRYARRPDGSLEARISGTSAQPSQTYVFRRQP